MTSVINNANTETQLCETKNSTEFPEIQNFDDLDIPEELLRGIYSHGFEEPSIIQKKAIRPVKSGRDLIAQSNGTEKPPHFLQVRGSSRCTTTTGINSLS